MEENQNPTMSQSREVQTAPQQEVQSPPVQPSPSVPPSPIPVSPGNKNTFVMIGILVLVVLLGLLAYLMFTKNQSGSNPPSVQEQTTVPTFSPQVVPQQPEQELNNVDVGTPDAELQVIDSDLQKL